MRTPWLTCAKWMHGYMVFGALALAPPFIIGCSTSKSDTPGVIKVDSSKIVHPSSIRSVVNVAVGDSLPYSLSWTAAARATGYRVTLTVSATNGVWSSTGFAATPVPLPATAGPSAGLGFAFTAIAIPWDTATFTAVVESADANGPTGKTASVTWKVRRRAGPPGPIVIDSSRVLALVRVDVRPVVTTLIPGTRQYVCAFGILADGTKGIFPVSDTIPFCQTQFQKYLAEAPS